MNPTIEQVSAQLHAERSAREAAEKACAEMRDALLRIVEGHEDYAEFPAGSISGEFSCGDAQKAFEALSLTTGQDYVHRSELEAVKKAARKLKDALVGEVKRHRIALCELSGDTAPQFDPPAPSVLDNLHAIGESLQSAKEVGI